MKCSNQLLLSLLHPPREYILSFFCGCWIIIEHSIFHVISSIFFDAILSDAQCQVLDARDPQGTRCYHLEKHLKEHCKQKKLILLLNKVGILMFWYALDFMYPTTLLLDSSYWKYIFILILQCDLIPESVTKRWCKVLSGEYITVAFVAGIKKSHGKVLSLFPDGFID